MVLEFRIGLLGSYPVRDYINMSQRIEDYGFDEIHVYDDLMFNPAWPLLTLIGEGYKWNKRPVGHSQANTDSGFRSLSCLFLVAPREYQADFLRLWLELNSMDGCPTNGVPPGSPCRWEMLLEQPHYGWRAFRR